MPYLYMSGASPRKMERKEAMTKQDVGDIYSFVEAAVPHLPPNHPLVPQKEDRYFYVLHK